MSKQLTSILSIIRQMCLYWNVDFAHEKKTILHFKKMFADLERTGLSTVKPDDLMRLYHELRETSAGTDESVRRKFDYVRRVFKFAHAQGYIKRNPCELIKLPKCRRARINSLTLQELTRIEDFKPHTQQQQKAKDWFLFQCYTGLAWNDFKSFSGHSVIALEGKMYIHGTRGKTGTEYILPLTPKAQALCLKYGYQFGCRCPQVYNRELKTIGQLTDISITLTSHVGRRTFGQMMIDNSIRPDVVSKMLGHSSTAMTEKYYARVGMLRVVKDTEFMAA